MPTPLTLIKPFNLSSYNSKMLMKKRMVSVNQTEINNKITEHMKKKCDSIGIRENVFINNKIIMNKTPNQFKFISRVEKSNSKSPIKKMTFSYENTIFNYPNSNTLLNSKNKYSSNNGLGTCLNLEEENTINNLSTRIEKYCCISKRYKNNRNNLSNYKSDKNIDSSDINKSNNKYLNKRTSLEKSPFKFSLEDEYKNINKENDFLNDNFINYTGNDFNNNMSDNNIFLNISTCGATSIRKMFGEIENEKSKEKINQYKFKARPLKKDIFNYKIDDSPNNNDAKFFQSILEKSKQDKFTLDKIERDIVKKAKINEIKVSKYGINKNSNANNKKKTALVCATKRNININRNKIVDYNELMLTDE